MLFEMCEEITPDQFSLWLLEILVSEGKLHPGYKSLVECGNTVAR